VRSFGPHYRLQVLNAESFEEKLQNVYKELEISLDDYLPVNYRVENELLCVSSFKFTSLTTIGYINNSIAWVYKNMKFILSVDQNVSQANACNPCQHKK
jgi:hypothetical protein